MAFELDPIIPNSAEPEVVANANFDKVAVAINDLQDLAENGGLPPGGTAGQILYKTADGYEWGDPPSGGGGGAGVPPGGTTGQVLTKTSDADGDATWQTPASGGGSGGGGNGAVVSVELTQNYTPSESGGWSAIPWTRKKIEDVGGVWSAANPTRFTIPSGVIRVRMLFYVTFQNVGGNRYIRIQDKTGKSFPVLITNGPNEGSTTLVSGWITVEPGDYFIPQISNSTGTLVGSLDGTQYAGNPFFEIEMQGAAGQVNPVPGGGTGDSAISNYLATKYPRSRKALNAVKAELGRMKVGFMGDSNTAGEGAGTAGTHLYTGAMPRSFVAAVAKILRNSGVPGSFANFIGFAAGFNDATYDPRLTFSGGAGNDVNCLSGLYVKLTDASGFAFAPGEKFNAFRVKHLQLGGQGTYKVSINNDAPLATVVVAASPEAMIETEYLIPGDPAAHTVKITKDGGSGTNYFEGVQCYDTTRPKVECFNMGTGGKRAYDYVNNENDKPWHRLQALKSFGLDLLFIRFGVNEEIQSNTGDFQANMQAIITAALSVGTEVVLVMHGNHNGGQDFLPVANALAALSASNDLALIDLRKVGGTFAQDNAAGYWFDTYHPTALGYAREARTASKAILALA